MTHSFKAVSLSYKNAPLAIREQLALDGAACDQLLHVLQHTLGLTDVLVLGTCNRTEVYYCAAHDQREAIIAAVGQARGLANAADFAAYFTTYDSATAAARHLLEVALGLDAQVVGDAQIGNQVKIAYQRSADAGAAGPFLHRLLHTIFAAHKRVQQETAFHDGAASTASATLALVEALTAAVARPRVLLVGLGEMGADIGRYFAKSKHFADVVLCNRTPGPAEALAAELGLSVLAFEELTQGLQAADVVISAVAAPRPLFTCELLAGLDILTPKFFIDLSVPRSVDPAAESVPGVLVYNLDTIQRNAATALAGREAAVPQVQTIIAESLAGLHEWSREMQVSPLIQKLKSTLEQMRRQEVSRFEKQMSADEARRMEAATSALTQKFLKLPVLQLKAACQRGEADQLVVLLTELFALEA